MNYTQYEGCVENFLPSSRAYKCISLAPLSSLDVTAAMLMCRVIVKNVFWEFDSIMMQNLSDILLLFCSPTWPSHYVSENQEYATTCSRKWRLFDSHTRKKTRRSYLLLYFFSSSARLFRTSLDVLDQNMAFCSRLLPFFTYISKWSRNFYGKIVWRLERNSAKDPDLEKGHFQVHFSPIASRLYVRSVCYGSQISFMLKLELITITKISHQDSL